MGCASFVGAQSFTFVDLNCENLFDCRHDSLHDDMEFTPEGLRRWTPYKYWTKLNNISREILSSTERLPDLVALLEVENDSVLHDLTRRSMLRNARYDYLMTASPDVRGIDVALLYRSASFRPLCYDYISVEPLRDMRPTRDILHVKGVNINCDTLHIFVIHAPSRYGGEKYSRPLREHVAQVLKDWIHDSGISGNIIVAGDFNDYADSPAPLIYESCGLVNATKNARGENGVGGTYKYKGEWRSIDHVFLSPQMLESVDTAYVSAPRYVLEDDPEYSGFRPLRTFHGIRFQSGYSDHLPLVVRFKWK